MTRLKFILADQNHRRSAAITAALAGFHGVTVTDNSADLVARPLARCVVLAADEPGAIQRIVERLKETGIRAKIIAYGEDPSPHQMVKALSAGAADYLYWPCDPANIVAAANAATASAG